ncbi:MAG: 4Fe-4S binding protein [Elusimicrobia bacterium]|nr:4Fe-4S binding protein [Elusimicrobiota bacterium]
MPCDVCTTVCPVSRLQRGGTVVPDSSACLGCHDCVEACPQDALRTPYGPTSAMLADAAVERPQWLTRLTGAPGPAVPAAFPPSYLLAKPDAAKRPRYILGLAINTLQEHAAVLLKDGVVVGAIEEEKLARVRHYGWPAPGTHRYGFSLEQSFPRRAIRALLSKEGLTLDDMDLIAINGLPYRYVMSYARTPGRPMPVIRTGRLMFIPHHLSHAASAFRASGMKNAFVLTVDGRGERQTAAVFRAKNGKLTQEYELLSLVRRSIGGVYESATRLLGFGSHGQGIVMALASTGKPGPAFERFLSWKNHKKMSINEEFTSDIEVCRRPPDTDLKPQHRDLAASLQKSLEDTILGILDKFVPSRPEGLCIAGGVALNCRMNQLIRERFKPKRMFVQPAANDAGTALGAALEAHALTTPGAPAWTMGNAALGPDFTDAEIAAALDAAGVRYHRPKDVCRDAAKLLADGKIVAWFQGRLEFGPRALGSRSLLADPRRADTKDRVNSLKSRHPWRPFGPSILAGYESQWFSSAFDSRFMLFTVPVRADKQKLIPAVLHDDGTTRPQSVHASENPLYHRLITCFETLTGVPMVLNTSFNRKDEPIVCTPAEAIEASLSMGADALAIGPFLATGKKPVKPSPVDGARLRSRKGGRRLSLRLTVDCELQCPHCTIADLRGLPPRSFESALEALAAGRRAACDELVIMRGEPCSWPRLPELLAAARSMGYTFLQLQTDARSFARSQVLLPLVDAAEVVLLGPDAGTHDALSGVPGSFREALMGIKVLLGASKEVLVTVPVQRGNLSRLDAVAPLLAKLGAPRVQFNFPRPVQLARDAAFSQLARLSDAALAVNGAAQKAAALGLSVTTEGFPLCLLSSDLRLGAETSGDWDRFRSDDLTGVHDGMGAQISSRPTPPACRSCSLKDSCPRTWSLYLEMFGSSELKEVSHG